MVEMAQHVVLAVLCAVRGDTNAQTSNVLKAKLCVALSVL